ncbi:hypothetical protein [Galbibacter pacificus]|uniref:Uncharacterized protein n=1 Tax=Galbibacter pacificus TaxID=2996052 RepID=A0ABT6FME1_9FLAO|nr:hypothetical protein [Galbibacter pacificus]MDG3580954.1 hypothetical protein [Galbibacter pacificus]MDG3584432.1 hypothetical protein [Galbibacter pacificus]
MDNPFKKIIQNEKLPDSIKEKVMEDVNMIKLTLDVADLFMIKYPDTINDILNLRNDE